MNDDQFLKLFNYMQGMKAELSEEIAQVKSDTDEIKNVLDKHTGFLETDEIERLSLGKQVDRHEDWIERAAPKIDVRFSTST